MKGRQGDVCQCGHSISRHAYAVKRMPCRFFRCSCRLFVSQLALPFPTSEETR